MRLHYVIAIHIAFIVSLASIILGLGANDAVLPLIVCCAVLTSLILSDFTRILRLNHWISNTLIILIVAYSVGGLIRNRGEELAIGIAQILQLVQIVVLFQEKNTRNRFHLLLISFLQVVVASVFQQSFFFALLLFVYVFANFSVFTLIFLNEEHAYFAQHSFVRRYFLFTPSGLRENFNLFRLLKIIGATIFLGPLSLVLSYRSHHDPLSAPKTSTAIPPPAKKISTFGSPNPSTPNWPLLFAKPQFFGGTNRQEGLIGGYAELFQRLGTTAVWSLLFGITFFLLIPRYDEIVLFGDRFSYNRWKVNAQITGIKQVGFTEEIQLGEVSTVISNETQSQHFRLLTQGIHAGSRETEIAELLQTPPIPYSVLETTEFYLRGVTLEQYSNGRWSSQITSSLFSKGRSLFDARYKESRFYNEMRIPDLFFEKNTDMVLVESENIYKESPVICTFGPLWLPFDRQTIPLYLTPDRTEMSSRIQDSSEPLRWTYATTVFRDGQQLELIPASQEVDPFHYLQIDFIALPSLVELANRWDEDSGFAQDQVEKRAKYIAQRLSSDARFVYQLGGVRRTEGVDPLEDFVKNNPKGHCEYFAGTLAMMLRARGIPARVCVGYKVPADSQDENGYLVRESQAHSWVEAYIGFEQLPNQVDAQNDSADWPYGGWLRLDATPVGTTQNNLLQQTYLNFAAIRYKWQQWWKNNILNMGRERQMELVYQPIRDFFVYLRDHVVQLIQPDIWKR
ncbi:MAG: transglutaminase-like domain-containing protein [Thermoguttaceae bacterium]